LAPEPIREEAGTVVIPSIASESGKPTAIKSVNGVFTLTLTKLRRRVKAQLAAAWQEQIKLTRGATMKTRHILLTTLILATVWHAAAAQSKKKNIPADAPPPESILVGSSVQSNSVLFDLIALKPEMPLGPQDVLKSYEVAMNMVADKTSADFLVIVQAQHANQITRQQAEYLLQQSYQMAIMQYQVLSALHDVLKHDIDKAAGQQARQSLKAANSDTVLVVPFPESVAASR
jgi:hypothetical protein